MADYVSCPACHGKGLIPLEEAARIEAHVAADREEQAREQREREEQERLERAAQNRAELEFRLAQQAERHRRQQAAAASSWQPAPMWEAKNEAGEA
jgi:hypothetical protein